jgi:iron complex outermembrane receptor protein
VGGSIMDLAVKKATNAALAGKRPTGVSDMLAKIYLDYAIPVVPGLSVSAGAYHSGKMYKDAANLQEIQGNTVFDLGLHYATRIDGHAVRFDLSATNLTDKNYWITTSQLGIPRNVAFSMKFGF